MDSIRLQHLRCLTDTGDISLKPMTVLLGQNSSGKSTFLRFFPLLKQSVEARTSGPILWYGRLVDFGTYQEAKQKGQDEDIIFSFKLPYLPDASESLEVNIQLAKHPDKEFTITRQLVLKFLEHKVIIQFTNDQEIEQFWFNQWDVLQISQYDVVNNSLIPELKEKIYSREKKEPEKIQKQFLMEEKIKQISDNKLSAEELREIIANIHVAYNLDAQTMLSHLKTINNDIDIWQEKTKNWTIDTQDFREFWELILIRQLPSFLWNISKKLVEFSKQVRYIAPVRLLPERYERIRDLRTDEIEPRGENLSMFLYNLSEEDFKFFQEWTLKNFEFELRLIQNAGMVSIEVRHQESDQFSNIIDVGSGFSQILPVIAQLWVISEFKPTIYKSSLNGMIINSSPNSKLSIDEDCRLPFIFAIEQPELHLHPRLQGILTDVLVKSIKVAKENDIDLRLVIETHSKVLVNRLGQLIDKGTISSDDINLVLFEPSDNPQKVNVRTTKFDKDGYVTSDWPIGFLDMDLDLDVD